MTMQTRTPDGAPWLEFDTDLGGYINPESEGTHEHPHTWMISLGSYMAELRYYPGTPVHTVTSLLQEEVLAHIDLARERSYSGEWLPF